MGVSGLGSIVGYEGGCGVVVQTWVREGQSRC